MFIIGSCRTPMCESKMLVTIFVILCESRNVIFMMHNLKVIEKTSQKLCHIETRCYRHYYSLNYTINLITQNVHHYTKYTLLHKKFLEILFPHIPLYYYLQTGNPLRWCNLRIHHGWILVPTDNHILWSCINDKLDPGIGLVYDFDLVNSLDKWQQVKLMSE